MDRKTLLEYYNLFDPVQWYEEEGIKDFEAFKQWYKNTSKETHIYNLTYIAKNFKENA